MDPCNITLPSTSHDSFANMSTVALASLAWSDSNILFRMAHLLIWRVCWLYRTPGCLRDANSWIDANVDAVIWSVLESFTAVICASLICLRPLIVKFLPSAFLTTHISDIMRSPTPGWPRPINAELASKLRNGNYRFELHSQGNEMNGGSDNVIRVQKSWVTKTHPATEESIKMQGRSTFATIQGGKGSLNWGD